MLSSGKTTPNRRRRRDSCVAFAPVSLTNPVSATKPSRILIVDDDPDMRDLLAEILIEGGYTVDRAGDGAEALEVLHSTPTDAVLLDLAMLGMSGQEFLDRRAADPRLAKIPVIIISATAPQSLTTVGTFALRKPMEIASLLAMVGLATDRRFAAGTDSTAIVADSTDNDLLSICLEDSPPADFAP